MANARGEIRYKTADATEYALRPTWKAICDLETQFNTTLLGIAERLAERKFTAKDIVTTIWCGMKGAGAEISIEQVGEIVVRDGIFNAMQAVAEFVSEACTGGRTVDPKVKAEEAQ